MYLIVKKDGCVYDSYDLLGCVSDCWESNCEGYLKRKRNHMNSRGCRRVGSARAVHINHHVGQTVSIECIGG